MLDILARIRKSVPKTAIELRLALSDLDLDQAERTVLEAAEIRRRSLLDPDTKALDRAESALASSRRDLDRLRALEEDLLHRLAQAEVTEAAADLDRRRVDADKLAANAARILRERYAAIAGELTELVENCSEADDAVRAINSALAAAGRSDLLDAVEQRAWPVRPGGLVTRPAFTLHLSLPARGGFGGAGDGYAVAQLLGSIE